MKVSELHEKLSDWDREGRRVFTVSDLRKIFPEGKHDSFLVQIRKLAAKERPIIKRAARGVYVYNYTTRPMTNLIEEIAKTIRRGCYNYVSLESALSEHGKISQIPVGLLTVMTTGRSGRFETPWGDIEFSHTRQHWSEFIDDLQDVGRPLRLASPERAMRDIRCVGRNVQLLEDEPEMGVLDACI